MFKIIQARLQQYMNREIPDVQAGFRKGRGTRDQIANICWIIAKARQFRRTSTSALLTTPKPLTVCITTNCGKFFKRLEYQTTWPASWEICMQVKKQQLELDTDQRTGPKLVKEYIKAMLSPCLFNLNADHIMQNARLDEAQARIKIAGRHVNNVRYIEDITLTAKNEEELESLDESERGESKSCFKTQYSKKTKIMVSSAIISWQRDGETMETVTGFIFLGSKITADGDCSHEIKRYLLLGRKAMTNLDSILKSRDITLPTKVRLVKAMVFPVVIYVCET